MTNYNANVVYIVFDFKVQLIIIIRFKQQKMLSIQQLIREPQLEPTRSPLGSIMKHIPPKLESDDAHFEDPIDFNDNSSSMLDLPKFATVTGYASNNTNQDSRIVFERISKTRNQFQEPIKHKLEKNNLVFIAKIFIWLGYLMGTSQAEYSSLNFFHVFDFIGMFIAVMMIAKKVVKSKKYEPQLDDGLHILGVILTIVLFSYKPSSQSDYFLSVLQVARSVRLFFPLNYDHAFKDLTCKYTHKIVRIVKVSFPFLVILCLFSMVFSQSIYSQIHNRCRTPFIFGQPFSPPLDSQLCGQRECANGFTCLNPMTYDIQPEQSQYSYTSQLAFGYFQYKTYFHSIFATFCVATLPYSSQIISIYSNSSPQLIIVIVNILAILFLQFYLTPSLLVLIQQFMKDNQNQIFNSEHNNQKNQTNKNRNLSGIGDLSSVAAPTFGPNSSKEMQTSKFKQSDVIASSNQQAIDCDKKSNDPNMKRSKFKQVTIKQPSKTKICPFQIWKCVALWFTVFIAFIHFGLAIAFEFPKLTQLQNRKVGICLGVIFIIWTFLILMHLYNQLFDDEQEANNQQFKQQKAIILKIQILIYLANLLDYICRIMIGVYILEQASPITSFSTSFLLLRIVYLPLIAPSLSYQAYWIKLFNRQLQVFTRIISNITPYIFFMIIVSIILACSSFQLNTQTSFIAQTMRHFAIFANHNWINFSTSEGKSIHESTNNIGFIIKFILIVAGQLIIIKLILAESIMISLNQCSQSLYLTITSVAQQSPSAEEMKQAIVKQKSLFLISYQFLGIRQTLHPFLSQQNYTTNKIRLLVAYIGFSIIGFILLGNSNLYHIILIIMDFIIIFDAVINIIAFRFWGIGSFINYKFINGINFIINFIVIANFTVQFMDSLPLRITRIFLLIALIPEMQNSYNTIKMAVKGIFKLLPLLFIIWIIQSFSIAVSMNQITSYSLPTLLVKSMTYTFRMFQKGFDLLTHIEPGSKSDELGFYKMKNVLFYLAISLPFNCLCIGVILNFLRLKKQDNEDNQITKILQNGNQKFSFTKASEQYQKVKIRQRILSLTPTFDPLAYQQEGYFTKLFSSENTAYSTFKLVLNIFNACLLLSIHFLINYLSDHQLLQLKTCRLFFYILQILIFITESIVLSANNPYFKSKLLIYLFSFPGSFVMMVPMHKVFGSSEMKQVLQILVMLVPLSLLNLFSSFKKSLQILSSYLVNKMKMTLWVLLWFFIFAAKFSAILFNFHQKSYLSIYSSIIIGLFGGNFQIFSELQLLNKNMVSVYAVQVITFFGGLILRNCLLAVFIFEATQQLANYGKNCKNSLIVSDNHIMSLFKEHNFMDIWNKLDPKASGMLSFKTIINNLHHFTRCFQLCNIYLQFLLSPKSELYPMKLLLFRRLHIPIRTINVIDNQNDTRETTYMVTMPDLIAKFICLTLDQAAIVQQNFTTITDIKNNQSCTNWSTTLGFEEESWTDDIINKLNQLNKVRRDDWEVSQQFYMQKKIQFGSWSLGSVLKIFPTLRRRIACAKLKLQ